MKFGVAKLPASFCNNTEKSLNVKKNNNKELSSIEDRKVNTNLCYDGRKSFLTWQIQCRRYGGPCLTFWFSKNTFLEQHVTKEKRQ